MQDDIFEKTKRSVSIKDVVKRYTGLVANRYNQVCCPFHNEKTPSFTIYPETNTYNCFGCEANGDVIDFVARLKGIEMINAVKMLIQDYHLNIDLSDNISTKKASINNLEKISTYIKDCIKHVNETNFFKKRGITETSVKQFSLGYDPKTHEAIFPYSRKLEYYQSRNVNEKQFKKPPTELAGNEPLYNEDLLKDTKKIEPVFIVESPICAISITQNGGRAIALCGTSGVNNLIKFIKKHKPTAPLMLCLDNDEPGNKAKEKLDDELTKLNIICLPYNLADECKDPNELMLKDPIRFKRNVGLGKSRGNKFTIKGTEFSLAELQFEELPEIYFCVNEILPQGLTVMAAPPKAGKSFFALQLSIAISLGKNFLNRETNKSSVLYLALEDNKQRIKARSKRLLVDEKIWPSNLYINLLAKNMDSGLLNQLKDKLRFDPQIKLIIIDTLQKIRGKSNKNETAYTTDYNELGKIKEFADKYDIAILLVHHYRKQKDVDDVFNQFSGSNGINGVSDNMLAFQSNKDLPMELKCKGRDIYFDPIAMEFNKDTYMWEALGSIEEQKEKQKRKQYEENDLVKVCKFLAPKDWTGTATQFVEQGSNYLGYSPYISDRMLGKELETLAPELKAYDKIMYIRPNKTSRIHKLFCIQEQQKQLKIENAKI